MLSFRYLMGFVLVLATLSAPAFALDENSNANDVQLWFRPWETPPNTKINQDATTQVQNEEQVMVNPKDPDNLVSAWRDFRLGYRRVGWGYSFDGGMTWTEGGLMSGTPYPRHSDPGVDVDTSGKFFIHVLSFENGVDYNGLFSTFSTDGGQSWFPVWSTIVDGVVGAFEDKQLMACDRTAGPTSGNLYVPWARFAAGTDIYCAASTDNGWSYNLEELVSDVSSVQWPEPAVGPNGEVYVAWISYVNGAIMIDKSVNQGRNWGTDKVLATHAFGDTYVNGGIWVFSYPSLDIDIFGGLYHGRMYCTFTDIGPAGALDVYLTHSDDQGDTWSPRLRVNDDPLGLAVDQFHPWLTVNPDGVVSIVWIDRRLDPGANYYWDIYIAHSFDGGQTFTLNQRVSDMSSSPGSAVGFSRETESFYAPPDPRIPTAFYQPMAGLIGEYIGLATSKVRSNIVWTDTRNGNQDIYAAAMNLRLFEPKLATPGDEQILTDPHPIFTWSNWSDYDSALTYAVEYTTILDFSSGVTRVDGLSLPTHDPGVLPDDIYYWRVRAFDHYGDSSGWATRSFGIDTGPPAIPTMISPPDESEVYELPLVFAWSTVTAKEAHSSPVSYTVEVAVDEAFTVGLHTSPVISGTQYEWPMDTDPLAYDIIHYWRVIAEDGAGFTSGPPADPFEFFLGSYRPGDWYADGHVNPVDVVHMVNYVYLGIGDLPDPPIKADLNCDGNLANPLDMVWMVNHVYLGIIELEICTY